MNGKYLVVESLSRCVIQSCSDCMLKTKWLALPSTHYLPTLNGESVNKNWHKSKVGGEVSTFGWCVLNVVLGRKEHKLKPTGNVGLRSSK